MCALVLLLLPFSAQPDPPPPPPPPPPPTSLILLSTSHHRTTRISETRSRVFTAPPGSLAEGLTRSLAVWGLACPAMPMLAPSAAALRPT